MGQQIIKQPDGLYAIFSSITDTWIVYDADRQEIFDYYAERAKEDADRTTKRILDVVDAGHPNLVYHQFAMTFAEANRRSVEHDGDDLSDKMKPARA